MKKEIIRSIKELSGKYSEYEVFRDWVEASAIMMQNATVLIHDDTWEKREAEFNRIMKRYSPSEQKKIAKMFAELVYTFETEGPGDVLGEIYMEAGCGNRNTGQFFTPYHLSELTAQVALLKDVSEKKPLIMNEPSCGGGGMIIAAAGVLKNRGLNYQKCMKVVAQDLDWNSVYMTYVQLSLLGIKAVVAQGNTLEEVYHRGFPKERVFKTPAEMGVLL